MEATGPIKFLLLILEFVHGLFFLARPSGDRVWCDLVRSGAGKAYLWLVINTHVSDIDFKVSGTLHHHPATDFVLSHFFLEPILREARAVEVVSDTSVTDVVTVVVEIEGHVAIRGHEVEGRSSRGGFSFWRSAVVKKDLGYPLMPVGHSPHQGAPVIPVLLIHIDTGIY